MWTYYRSFLFSAVPAIGGFVAFTLKDATGGIVAVFVNEAFDVRTLETALPDKAVAQTAESVHGLATNMPAGEFDVFVSVGQRDGTPKILPRCSLPLTGKGVVETIITDLCVFTVNSGGGLTLIELQPGVSVDEVRSKTGCGFFVSPGLVAHPAAMATLSA